MKNNSNISVPSIEGWIKPVISGTAIGLTVTIILFVLAALIMSFNILPTSAANIIASIIITVGTFIGGFVAAKKLTKNGIFIGALIGIIVFILFTIIGMAAFGSAPSTSTLIRLLIFITSGAIGGIIGVGGADKRKIV